MKTNFKRILSLLVFFIFSIPFLSKAVTFSNPFQSESVWELIDKITNFLVFIGLALVPIFVIIAAFYFLSAGGDPKKVEQAKKILLYALIGLFILLLFRGIIYLIFQLLGISVPPSEPMPPAKPAD
jgi:purine-cytosine permease-like protein